MAARKLGFLFLLLASVSFFTGCRGVKGVGKGGTTDYTSFYLGDGNLQYFVKPIELESENSKFSIDFTIRQIVDEPVQVIANFSIFSKSVAQRVELMKLVGNEIEISPLTIDKIFIEGTQGDFHYRGTSTYDYEGWKTFMNSFKEIHAENEVFVPGGKTTKQIEGLQSSIMLILE